MSLTKRASTISFFSFLFVVDWFLFFRHGGHFFQGDTIFLLNHRATSAFGYLMQFGRLNPSGFYRPLGQELFESVLYPIAGLSPIPYRLPVYAVFAGITILVHSFTLTLTGRRLAAAIAALFFNIHTVNAYTTYDLGFMPELLYTFFYIGGTLAFYRYTKGRSKVAYGASLACLIGSLLSKEAAVMFPVTLLLTSVAFDSASNTFRERLLRGISSTVPHFVLVIAFAGFTIGYLRVQELSVTKVFDASQKPNPGDYVLVFNRGFLKNADLASTWAFNIPREWWGHWQHLTARMLSYLKFFRALVCALILVALVGPQRKIVLFGMAWFWITIFPALPLVAHFIPYYLFLPIAGFSIVVGVVTAWLYDKLSRIRPPVAAATIVLLFGGSLYVNDRIIRTDIQDNRLLGASAKVAGATLGDLKRLYPTLPDGTTLYFADARERVDWEHDSGSLIKMAYETDKISILYESQGDSLAPFTPNALVFRVRNGRLIDRTPEYYADK
jgi:hypothetical protein